MINVRDVLYVVDHDDKPLRSINDKSDLSIEHIENLMSELTVTIPMFEEVEVEQQLLYRDKRYIIREIVKDRADGKQTITAEIAYLRLNDHIRSVTGESSMIMKLAGMAVKGTGWWIRYVSEDSSIHNIDVLEETPLSILRHLAQISGTVLRFDTMRYSISFVSEDEMDVGFLFRYRKNIEEISKEIRKPKATTLIPRGSDGMDISSVNEGKHYVENFSWYESLGFSTDEARARFNMTHILEDNRFVYAGNLMRYAERELEKLSQPQIAYNVTISHIGKGVKIGSYGYVVDVELGIKVKVRIVRMVEHENYEDSEIELNYLVPGLSERQDIIQSGGGGQQVQTVLVYNKRDFEIDINHRNLLEMSFTSTSDTNLQLGVMIVGKADKDIVAPVVGNFYLDGHLIEEVSIKQQLMEGFNTISISTILPQIEAGSHELSLSFRIEHSGGIFLVEEGDANMFVMSENLSGGTSSSVPRINIIEEVTFPNYINAVNEHVVVELDVD